MEWETKKTLNLKNMIKWNFFERIESVCWCDYFKIKANVNECLKGID